MKQLIAYFLVITAMAFGADQTTHDHAKMSSDDKMDCELKDGQACTAISIPTAQCSMCEKTITTALEAVDGVSLAKVDAKIHNAHVHYASADIKIADLEKAIAAVGYDANDLKRDETVHAKLPQCCQLKK